MNPEKIIQGKRVLIVDDEKDVLDVLSELLEICKIDAVSSFQEGRKMLRENDYDMVILDIQGVQGFDLLELANERKTPALMLTAHGLSEENLKKSVAEGAAYYAPKDEMMQIATFMADVFEALDKGRTPWQRLVERLGGFYDKRFGGSNWRKKEIEFVLRKGGRYL
ncbi:MAG: response regulator [Deltaproteobacteria bacterium]|nr:response regulator [Deltaproteobacteria bacterium]